jgi:hypothetical protein
LGLAHHDQRDRRRRISEGERRAEAVSDLLPDEEDVFTVRPPSTNPRGTAAAIVWGDRIRVWRPGADSTQDAIDLTDRHGNPAVRGHAPAAQPPEPA